jgi:hypothetical protein
MERYHRVVCIRIILTLNRLVTSTHLRYYSRPLHRSFKPSNQHMGDLIRLSPAALQSPSAKSPRAATSAVGFHGHEEGERGGRGRAGVRSSSSPPRAVGNRAGMAEASTSGHGGGFLYTADPAQGPRRLLLARGRGGSGAGGSVRWGSR